MARSDHGGAARGFLVALLLVLVIALGGAVVYLLSNINHGRYRLAVYEGTLVVERGRMLPLSFTRFVPQSPELQSAYAPVPMPPGESLGKQEVFEDRADLDRAMFSLLANWAHAKLDSKEPGDFDLATSYVSRCELLPGLSEEQRAELRTLRGDLAFRTGRRILADVVTQMQKALENLQLAKKLGTSRPVNVDGWIADVQRRIRDYRAAAVPAQPAPSPEPGTSPFDAAEEPTTPPASPLASPPIPEQPEALDPPRWRL